MSDLEQKPAGDNCNARKADGSGYCSHAAGWGTDHPGHGRCKFHGGNTKDHEKNIIDKLEGAAGDAAVSLKLRLKHAREKAEAGEFDEIDWAEIDRHARTVFDRAGPIKREKRELEDVTDGDNSFGTTVVLDSEYVDDE